MNSEMAWDPSRLADLTLVQLQCLGSKLAPGSAPVLDSLAAFEDELARIEEDEREWHRR